MTRTPLMHHRLSLSPFKLLKIEVNVLGSLNRARRFHTFSILSGGAALVHVAWLSFLLYRTLSNDVRQPIATSDSHYHFSALWERKPEQYKIKYIFVYTVSESGLTWFESGFQKLLRTSQSSSALKMSTQCFSEILVSVYGSTRRYNPEG